MAAVTTERLVAMAYELAGWDNAPPDWLVFQPGTRISHILFGLEIGPADLLMARQLGYHAVISYEPVGYVGPAGPRMSRHIERMVVAGVPRDEAIAASTPGALAHRAAMQARNYDHAPSVARMLEIPFLTVYEPLAEVGRRLLQERIDQRLGEISAPTLADVRDAALALPSFAQARVTPQPVLGEWTAPAGKVAVLDSDWGPPSREEVSAYFKHGIRTLCCVDYPLADALALSQEGYTGSILTLGRIAAESVGVLPYVTRLRDEGIEVATFAGVLGV